MLDSTSYDGVMGTSRRSDDSSLCRRNEGFKHLDVVSYKFEQFVNLSRSELNSMFSYRRFE